jgi:hypothetical protein
MDSKGTKRWTWWLTRRWRLGGSRFKANPGKKLERPHLNQKKLAVIVHTCHSSHKANAIRRISDRLTKA